MSRVVRSHLRAHMLLVPVLCVVSCGGGDTGGGTSPQPLNVRTLGWIESKGGRLTDEFGRQWLFRGINARVQGLFDGSGEWAIAPAVYEAWDAQRMADLGFNLFRLPINWSGLEPTEGEFSESYLELLDEVVALAHEAGLYVLIDFHQDNYSKFIGDDGAPKWAIYPPLVEGEPEEERDVRVFLANMAFFNNMEGIQDRFLEAWQLIVSRYADKPHVVGFEVWNEPWPLLIPSDKQKLYSFYERAAATLREIDDYHAIWLEPDVSRNLFLVAPIRETPFPDDNVVYTPHMYPNLNGMDYETVEEWTEVLEPSFDCLILEAESWGGAPVIGEWGTHPYDPFAPSLFAAVQDLADARNIGLVFWVWKERASGYWGLFDHEEADDTWTERSGPGMDVLIRPSVMAVPGRLLGQVLDQGSRTLTIQFDATGGEGPPLIYIPERRYPEGALIELDGVEVDVRIDTACDRVLVPWGGKAGRHSIVIRPRDAS